MNHGNTRDLRIWAVTWAAAALIGLLAFGVSGDIPKKISYQGRLTDTSGMPLTGDHIVFFALHNAESGGIMLWSETQTVTADTNGVFSTILGSNTPIQISFEDSKWLGITVDGNPLTPRREIVSVASAFNAMNADSLGGLAGTSYAVVGHGHHALNAHDGSPVEALYVDDSGKVGIGTTSPGNQLHIYDGASGGTPYGLSQLVVESDTSASINFLTPGFHHAGLLFGNPNNNMQGWLVYDHDLDMMRLGAGGGNCMAIRGLTGNIGIRTQTPTAMLDIYGSTGYDQLRVETPYTPTSTTDGHGNVGDIAWDDNFIYVKTSVGWKRAALAAWGL
jgi:hypothetical protein